MLPVFLLIWPVVLLWPAVLPAGLSKAAVRPSTTEALWSRPEKELHWKPVLNISCFISLCDLCFHLVSYEGNLCEVQNCDDFKRQINIMFKWNLFKIISIVIFSEKHIFYCLQNADPDSRWIFWIDVFPIVHLIGQETSYLCHFLFPLFHLCVVLCFDWSSYLYLVQQSPRS